MASLLEVSCIGEFKVRLDGIAIPALTNSKPLALWLYLALGGAARSRVHLANFFWGELGDEAARGNLRLALMRLRKLVPEHIHVTRDGVAVPPDCRYSIDALALLAADAASSQAADSIDAGSLEAMLLLRPEDFLASLQLRHSAQFDDWVSVQRRRLVDGYLTRLTLGAERMARQGGAASAVDSYRRCLSIAPWSEDHHRALIACYAALGQRASALAQFEACRRALREELDVGPSEATLELVEDVRRAAAGAQLPTSPEPQPSSGVAVDSLVAQAPRVDRPAERDQVAGLLQDEHCRLVSIVGPGGVGKTHLARQLARSLADVFRDGVCFVPLADVEAQLPGQAATLVEKRIAEALALTQGSAGTRAALLKRLAECDMLLILDNFEQLTDAAGLIDAIALRASRVRVLVTTRHRLRLPTEWVLTLGGLNCPDSAEWCDDTLTYPAVELFVKVAERVEAGFDPALHGPDVIRICRAVAGYPLAIVIAARWLTTLTCRQIADQLEESFALLDRNRDDEDRPQQTLSAVLDRSWALLGEAERNALSGLGVFRGGFTTAAAETICDCELELLDRLVTKSLVRPRGDGRFEIHELTRDYAERRLEDDAAAARAVREAHAAYYGSLLREELELFERDPLRATFADTRTDLSNLVAAFDHLVRGRDVEPLSRLLAGLWAFHKRLGWFADGAALLRRALAVPGVPLEQACRWRLWLSDACFQLGRLDECKEVVLESLAQAGEPTPEGRSNAAYVWRELGKQALPADWISLSADRAVLRDELARTHNRLAQVYFFEGDRLAFLGSTLRSMNVAAVSEAVEHWASGALALAHTPLRPLAARYARRANLSIRRAEPFAEAWAHEQLALYHLGIAEYEDAEHHAGRGAALSLALGQHKYWGECATLHVYAAQMRGELTEARKRFGEVVHAARELKEHFSELWGLCGLAHTTLRSGSVSEVDLAECAALIGRIVDPNTDLLYYGNLAWLNARHGRATEALEALTTCRRVVRRASMLSVYALNGFIGQAMAVIELAGPRGSPAAAVTAAADAVLGDFERFAAPFPAVRPYALYLKARWLMARGDTARGMALHVKALARFRPTVDPSAIDRSFCVEAA